jgi:hypothetical protein
MMKGMPGYLCLLLLPALAIVALGQTVHYDHPTKNCNGSDLTDLAGVKVHFGRFSRPNPTATGCGGPSPATFAYEFETPISMVTSIKICPEEPGQYYYAATAWDNDGNFSAYSPEIPFTVTGDECTTIAPRLLDLF